LKSKAFLRLIVEWYIGARKSLDFILKIESVETYPLIFIRQSLKCEHPLYTIEVSFCTGIVSNSLYIIALYRGNDGWAKNGEWAKRWREK